MRKRQPAHGWNVNIHLQQEQASGIRMGFGPRIVAYANFHCSGSTTQPPLSNRGAGIV